MCWRIQAKEESFKVATTCSNLQKNWHIRLTNFDLRGIEQGEHSPDNVKFPDGSRHSAC